MDEPFLSEAEQALRAAIANPMDDAPRAALADWLADHPNDIHAVLQALLRGHPSQSVHVVCSYADDRTNYHAAFLCKETAEAYRYELFQTLDDSDFVNPWIRTIPVGRPPTQD